MTPIPGRQRPPSGDVAITAVGMVSAAGATAAQTFASVRAGVSRLQERPELYLSLPAHPHLDKPAPVVASAVDHLDIAARTGGNRTRWLGQLAAEALRDLLDSAALGPGAEPGLYVCLPPARPGWDERADAAFTLELHNRAELDLLPHRRYVHADGPGALALFDEAREALARGQLEHAIVGAVDSWLFPDWLEALDRDWRLYSPRSPDGFRPGEGAAFALLERADRARRRDAPIRALVRASADAQADPGAPSVGRALADAVSAVLDGAEPPPLVVCDLNGEPSRTKDWAFALSRLGRALPPPVALEAPAAMLGDLGAATGAALVVLATLFLEKKYTGSKRALVWSAAGDGRRRALLLERA